ncbi:MAG: hypothetical protein M0Q38_04670 [Bacteroidales bacterium]|jgi:hypothetical protein|nr:hypothetical protein [Bacteroidales bacterium]
MTLFQFRHRIESTRNPYWDYHSAGYYFVTICTRYRQPYFGSIFDRCMTLSCIGKIVKFELLQTAKIRDNVIIDEWVIMPDHIHVIFRILPPVATIVVETHRGANPDDDTVVETHRGANPDNDTAETHRGANPDNDTVDDTVETHRDASLLRYHDSNSTGEPIPTVSSNRFGPQSNNLPAIVRGFKSAVKRWTNLYGLEFHWQARYHDHIIRDRDGLEQIRMYIRNNPVVWKES